jgi:hypothetical protein
LQDQVANFGLVDIRQDMVVAEDQVVARAFLPSRGAPAALLQLAAAAADVTHQAAERASGDVEVADAVAGGCRSNMPGERQRHDLAHLDHIRRDAVEFRGDSGLLGHIFLGSLLLDKHGKASLLSRLPVYHLEARGHPDDVLFCQQLPLV